MFAEVNKSTEYTTGKCVTYLGAEKWTNYLRMCFQNYIGDELLWCYEKRVQVSSKRVKLNNNYVPKIPRLWKCNFNWVAYHCEKNHGYDLRISCYNYAREELSCYYKESVRFFEGSEFHFETSVIIEEIISSNNLELHRV